jgi:hypothetical protein
MLSVRRLLVIIGLVAAVALVATAPAQAQDTTPRCAAVTALKPGNEVPPVDSRTSGAAAIHISGTRLSFAVAISNPDREEFCAGHIHIGAAGVNGPVRVLLFSGSSNRRLFTQVASIGISLENARAICGDLAGHYINYHTRRNPGGELRGQLVRVF